jgi:hypothetical protein
MTLSPARRLATAAVLTGVAGIALATPAAAMVDPAPQPNPAGERIPEGSSAITDDSPWAEIGVAVVGGIALAGVAVAGSAAVRRRNVAHTA